MNGYEPLHKVSFMNLHGFIKFGVEELMCPAQSLNLNPNEHLCYKLEHRVHLWPNEHKPPTALSKI